MNKTRNQFDEALKQGAGKDELTGAESEALWERIEGRLDQPDSPPVGADDRGDEIRRFPRFGFALAVVALAAIVVAGIALTPWDNAGSGDGAFDLAGLESASAAEVLELVADGAQGQASLVPGPGQALYYRLVHTTDRERLGDTLFSEVEQVEIEEWMDADGKGVRLDGLSGSSSMVNGKVETKPLTTKFDASKVDRNLSTNEGWRSIFTLDQLKGIPAEPDAALAYLRRATTKAIGGQGERTAHEAGIIGTDSMVVMLVASMLMEAPLTAEQRAGFYELLSGTPDWYSNDGSADIDVENKGSAAARDGREGILIELKMELNEIESAIIASGNREVGIGVLLDPEAGTVLETQVSFGDGQPPFLFMTSESLELRDSSEMPRG